MRRRRSRERRGNWFFFFLMHRPDSKMEFAKVSIPVQVISSLTILLQENLHWTRNHILKNVHAHVFHFSKQHCLRTCICTWDWNISPPNQAWDKLSPWNCVPGETSSVCRKAPEWPGLDPSWCWGRRSRESKLPIERESGLKIATLRKSDKTVCNLMVRPLVFFLHL